MKKFVFGVTVGYATHFGLGIRREYRWMKANPDEPRAQQMQKQWDDMMLNLQDLKYTMKAPNDSAKARHIMEKNNLA